MNDGQQERLMSVFLQELEQRTASIERDLLAIEGEGALDEKRQRASSLLNSAHSLKGAAGLLELKPIEAICHSMEDLFARGEPARWAADEKVIQLLLRANDQLGQSGRLLAQGKTLQLEALASVERELRAIVETFAGANRVEKSEPVRVAPAQAAAPAIEQPPAQPAPQEESLSIRVPAAKIDRLLGQSAELLIACSRERSRVEHLEAMAARLRALRSASPHRSPGRETDELLGRFESELHALAEDCRQIDIASSTLDDEVQNLRLQPFSAACAGLDRLVRDLSAASGKQVSLDVHGGDVQLDRSLIQSLGDILRHLVRNAVDHGIESPPHRQTAGKPARGRLVISAAVNGDRVDVTLADDGAGIDLHRIRAEADRLGRPATETDTLHQIFEPGLSTAQAVTTVSGRGVGLDIVRSTVESLRGAVDVTSRPGRGVTFKVTLPLTLGLIRALHVRAGDHRMVIDTSGVDRVVRVLPEDLRVVDGKLVVLTGGRPAPALELSDWLGLDGASPAEEEGEARTAILLNEVGRGAAVLVDGVVAVQECLVRPLGARVRKLREFAGGSIMPDGTLVLVLNAAYLGECADAGHTAPARPQPASRRRHILIAEDSVTVRTLSKTILEGVGYKVTAVAAGDQAWQMLQSGDVDLIVADVDMPGLNGYELTQKVRHSMDFRNIPVVLLTGRDSDADKQRGLEAGADAYLVKSAFDQNELLNAIGYLL